jgi:cellulose synthase (UDP-forming)
MGLKPDQGYVPSEPVFKWWDYPIFTLLSGLNIAVIFYFLSEWFSVHDWVNHPLVFSLMTLILLTVLANNQGRWFLLPQMKKPVSMRVAKPDLKVAVVTSFVPEAESPDMLNRTLGALVSLDYPHDTWVLDEGGSAEVELLCRKVGARYFTRKQLPHYQTDTGKFQSGSKHGNYNAWLYEIGFAKYDVIAIFDPDHVPVRQFLSRVLPYFNYGEVAYVQAPQAYYNQKASFIAQGAAEETYSYFSCIKMASYGMGFPIIVGGHNTHRVAALKDVGGLGSHDADDLALTFLYRTSGWHGIYLPEILARGLTPVDWNGYLDQQRRWGRSVLDLKLKLFWRMKELPWKTGLMSVLHGLNYVSNSLLVFLSLILLALMLSFVDSPSVVSWNTIRNLIGVATVLQLSEFYRQRFYLDWRSEHGLHWKSAFLRVAKWPYHVFAVLDVLLSRRIPYILTSKTKMNSRQHRLMEPHLCVASAISAAWLVGRLFHHPVHPLIQLLAAVVVALSLLVIASEFRTFPPPYSDVIASEQLTSTVAPVKGCSQAEVV